MTQAALLARLDRVGARRDALLDHLATLDPAGLALRPADAGWSLLEVVEHLVVAERDVLGWNRPGGRHEVRPRRLKHRIRRLIVMAVLRFGIDVKAPSAAMLPGGGKRLGELRAMWEENHRRLRELLAGLDGAGMREPLFRHPISGPLTAEQGVAMLDVHLTRHLAQLRRIEAAVGG